MTPPKAEHWYYFLFGSTVTSLIHAAMYAWVL